MLVGQYLNGVFTRGLTGKFNTNETRTFYFVCGYCGKTFESSMRNLLPRTGRKYGKDHCGCQRTARQQQGKGIPPSNKLDDRTRTVSQQHGAYKASANTRDLECTLTREDIENLIFSHCFFCGSPPKRVFTLGQGQWARDSVPVSGIDRIDSSAGYVLGNVLSCCSYCNYLKGDRDQDEFLLKIKHIYENLKL